MKTKTARKTLTQFQKLCEFLIEQNLLIWQLEKSDRRILLFAKRENELVFGISSTPSGTYDVGVLSETKAIGGDLVLLCEFFLPKHITKRRLEELSVYLQGVTLQPDEHAILTDDPVNAVWDFANSHGYFVRRMS